MRRTIAAFKHDFETNILPGVSDYNANRIKKLIAEAETEARLRAKAHVEELERQVLSLRDEALHELTEVRDSFDDLARDGQDARVRAADYSSKMAELRKRQDQAEEQLAHAEAIVEDLEAVEADPIEWFDKFTQRMPMLMKDW